MSRMTVIVGVVIVGVVLVASAGHAYAQKEATPPALKVDGLSAEYHLGDSLSIVATGDAAEAARKELLKADEARAITLYLHNVAMKDIPVAALDRGTDGVQLTFTLVRNANDDENRRSWDALLKKCSAYSSKLPVSLALGSALPVAVRPPDAITFAVAPPTTIRWVTAGALVLFALTFVVLLRMRPTVFRDGIDGPYSLGKTQMIFWGLLVFFGVAAVFVITRNLERIPPQTLMLLGISVGTGLGAVLVTKSKRAEAEERAKTLASEQQQLTQSNNPQPAGVQARIDAITNEMTQLQPSRSESFLKDIASDGSGLSFHRVQVVIWTLLLGTFFGFSVASVISMPEFPDSLLILMGISNGTYLSLKIPEKP